MVLFSTPLIYLDPPNWQQHPANNEQRHLQIQGGGGGGDHDNNQYLIPPPPRPQPPPPPPPLLAVMGGGPPSSGVVIRPNSISMIELARRMNIRPPRAPLNCPRSSCGSTNTKFCYYNNHSLSQPRHYCRNCQRYWTHGGALRDVPVGGRHRRNRRSLTKSSGGGSSSGGGRSSATTGVGPANVGLTLSRSIHVAQGNDDYHDHLNEQKQPTMHFNGSNLSRFEVIPSGPQSADGGLHLSSFENNNQGNDQLNMNVKREEGLGLDNNQGDQMNEVWGSDDGAMVNGSVADMDMNMWMDLWRFSSSSTNNQVT